MENKGISKRLWQLFGIFTIITVISFTGCSNPTGVVPSGGEDSEEESEEEVFKHPEPNDSSQEDELPDMVTITFISNVKENTQFKVTVEKEAVIKEPEDPEQDGMDFKGWVYKDEPTRQVAFKAPVTRDMTFIADWGTTGLEYGPGTRSGEFRIMNNRGLVAKTVVVPSFHNGTPVTAIDSRAFFTNSNIQSVTIGAHIISIGDAAFNDSGLTDITFANGSKLEIIGTRVFQGSNLTAIEIPAGVTVIEMETFSGITSRFAVTFANGSKLEKIEEKAFYRSGLTSIEIPASVETLRDRVFAETPHLDQVIFARGSKVQSIPTEAFLNSSVRKVTLPNALERIQSSAFKNTKNLLELEIPSTVTDIRDRSFDGWNDNQSIYIPFSIRSVPKGWGDWRKGCDAKIIES